MSSIPADMDGYWFGIRILEYQYHSDSKSVLAGIEPRELLSYLVESNQLSLMNTMNISFFACLPPYMTVQRPSPYPSRIRWASTSNTNLVDHER